MQPNHDVLLHLVLEADEEGFNAGEGPKKRSMTTISRVMKKLGQDNYIGAGYGRHPLSERISNIIKQLYRPQDIAAGGVHMGAFMFRDIFGKVEIPLIFGIVDVDPLRFINLNDNQIKWMCKSPIHTAQYYDQFTDIMDFGYGLMEIKIKVNCQNVESLFANARFHLQAAAAVVTSAFDYSGAIQSAIIATELVLKGGLAALGVSEPQWRKHSHDLSSAAKAFANLAPNFDINRVLIALKKLPPYVENRYSGDQPPRLETGHIIMSSQYIAGEVMRQLSDRNFRRGANKGWERIYPPLDTSPSLMDFGDT